MAKGRVFVIFGFPAGIFMQVKSDSRTPRVQPETRLIRCGDKVVGEEKRGCKAAGQAWRDSASPSRNSPQISSQTRLLKHQGTYPARGPKSSYSTSGNEGPWVKFFLVFMDTPWISSDVAAISLR
ncbi:hypothetical protein BO78DRAFT_85332 [Aspergillus sclerotiicarbonarius CBS 121057]|uniref:Uncharacterized protein n=1 Tax=Aspergillus sclerotiicarbonarius (strain CBS 121057 / IBT 28362) TaxID=1448318 RepID=A0A319EC64_ASPSB|nr:hypothetical protein BO78DRAFT_85332 [Aspergillus sclerotiicarbonarius CBS 121057]